jgi:peptidoglycan/LPS O-acetylase OafA/YrhL
MDLRRLRAGEWLAALSGFALLASLFLPWYGPESVTGWEALTAIDVLLAFVAASGVLLAIVTANQRVPAVPVALSALIALFGLFGVILVLIRVLDLPDWAGGREWALWLGLAGAVGIVAGSILAMRDEIRPGAAPVQVESLPAPRP